VPTDDESDLLAPAGVAVGGFGEGSGAAEHDDAGVVGDGRAVGAAAGGAVERWPGGGGQGLGLDAPEGVGEGDDDGPVVSSMQ
jgi:hypothetical protein